MSSTISVVTGKKAEMRFIVALIKRGFSPFIPIVDLGIDAVAEKTVSQQPPKYFAFQVKTSTLHKGDIWYWNFLKRTFRCAHNVYYVFAFEDAHKIPAISAKASDFNACIVPSIEIDRHGHWSPSNKAHTRHTFDIGITVNMLKNISTFSKRLSNSGITLKHFNDWKQLDC